MKITINIKSIAKGTALVMFTLALFYSGGFIINQSLGATWECKVLKLEHIKTSNPDVKEVVQATSRLSPPIFPEIYPYLIFERELLAIYYTNKGISLFEIKEDGKLYPTNFIGKADAKEICRHLEEQAVRKTLEAKPDQTISND